MIYRKLASKLNLSGKDVFFLALILILGLIAVWSYFNLDQWVFSSLCQTPATWRRNFWLKALTYLGRAWVPVWLMLIWFLSTGRQRPVLIAVLGLIIVGLIVQPLKLTVRRPRPREVIKAQLGQEVQADSSHHLSMPSGDAAVVFAVATVIIAFAKWPLACLLLALSAGVALLRVAAMAHYPSDVFAGAAIGSFAGWLALQIDRRRSPLKAPRFSLGRGVAISGMISMPLLFGLSKGIVKLLVFLKTYGLLAVCIFLIARGQEDLMKFETYLFALKKKMSLRRVRLLLSRDAYAGAVRLLKLKGANTIGTITRLADVERFYRILNWLRKRRTLALRIAFTIMIADNILDREKPHELFPWDEDFSTMAIIGLTLVIVGVFIRFLCAGTLSRDVSLLPVLMR